MEKLYLITDRAVPSSIYEMIHVSGLDGVPVSYDDFMAADVEDGAKIFPGILSADKRKKLMQSDYEIFDFGPGPGVFISEKSTVSKDAYIGPMVFIDLGAVIGDFCAIGACSVVHPGAVIGRSTDLGEACTVETGAVIGEGVDISPGNIIRTGECVIKNLGLKRVLKDGRWIKGEDE